MWPFLVLALQGTAQPAPPTPYDVLKAEHARGADMRTIERALASGDSVLQRLAVRAIGRFEDVRHAPLLEPMLHAPAASVRREAANAAAQLRAPALLAHAAVMPFSRDPDPSVRAALYESFGRVAPADSTQEAPLRPGLTDASLVVRRGAARGLESFIRRHARTHQPTAVTLAALASAFTATDDAEVRHVVLLALTAAGHRDSSVIASGLRDGDQQVRRAAVALGRVWVDDPSPMVRWQALRVAGDCARAAAHLRDSSEHVQLLAVDLLGEKSCDAAPLRALAAAGVAWRPRAHAVVALARTAPAEAGPAVRQLAQSPVWQARAWAAEAAKRLGDSATLARLARDSAPNVAIAAITIAPQALAVLERDHAGLLLHAATVLEQQRSTYDGVAAWPRLQRTFERISRTKPVTWRDPRVALFKVILPLAATADPAWLTPWLRDPDPVIASMAYEALPTTPKSASGVFRLPYVPPPFPSMPALAALEGATAELRIRGKGTITLRFLPEEAPMAVHTFVTLAEGGAYAGKTMHRIVPNFVIQGGSPGADEYDPATSFFMRDEVGFARNARGTFGISTRGRDTGDGQLYINLIDNVRLDHDYTVFAETVRGLDVVDRVQEGDVIESIVIRRARR
jgi:cyclophilin family peptidyl-prolyl cis-trans isomerase/HEAT repeat protein